MVMEPVNIANANCGSLKEALNSANETQESVAKLKVLFNELFKRVQNLEHTNDWTMAFLNKVKPQTKELDNERIQLLIKLTMLQAENIPEEGE